MTIIPAVTLDKDSPSCATDRSCPPESNCCGECPATGGVSDKPTSKTGLRAAVLGVLCVVGCIAGPLALGGAAAAFGAVSGAWWMVIGAAVLTAPVSVLVLARRRNGGSVC